MKRAGTVILLLLIAVLVVAQNDASSPAKTQTRRPPEAKTEEEYKAYQEATAKADAAEVEIAANQFAEQFPTSELRSLLYYRAMTLYQAANNSGKILETGRKILAIDPNHPVALVMVAMTLSEASMDSEVDREANLAEAERDARHALEVIDTELNLPANTPPEKVESYKNELRALAHATLGNVNLLRNNYAEAEVNLRKATELPVSQPDFYNWLRLSIVLDRQNKLEEALVAATKAMQIAPPNSREARLAEQERTRLLSLMGVPVPASPAKSNPN